MRRILRVGIASAGVLGLLVVAYAGWCVADAALRETKTYREAAPAGGEFVRAAGLDIFVQEAGPRNGRVVMLIPATAAWSETWRATLDALGRAGCRAIALDLPPFGFSERPAANAFSRQDQAARIIGVLDALQVREVTLVGHSIAGRATLEAAMRDRGRTKALVLVAASAGLEDEVAAQAATPGLIEQLISFRPLRNTIMAVVTQPAWSRRLLEGIVYEPTDVSDAMVHVFRRPLVVRESGARMGDWLQAIGTEPDRGMSSRLAEYARMKDVRALIVWGRQDAVIPLAQGERLARLLPQSRLVVFDRMNHAPHLEDASDFNRLLLDFLGGCAP